MSFRGTYDYALDAKNRLTIPAKMRAQLPESVVLSRGTQTCVTIWLKSEFDAFVDGALHGLGPLDPKRDTIKRFFLPNSFDAELDSAGRVMIPLPLLAFGELTKEVVVNGIGDRIEVWDRARWSTYNAGQDFDDLAALFADTVA